VIREKANGLLLLDKPVGPTSHDQVDAIRRIFAGAKTGHTGTLDPMASGLLVMLIGRATKLAPFVPGDPKVYVGSIMLGITTNTMDMEGEVQSRGACEHGPEEVNAAISSLVGERKQAPPMFSAAKYHGIPLYRYARKGMDIPRKSRIVHIYEFVMHEYRVVGSCVEVDFRVQCSPGTYIRELAAGLGDVLGCGGALSRLRRMESGPFRVEDGVTIETLNAQPERVADFLQPAERAVTGYGRVDVSGEWIEAVRNGMALEEKMLESVSAGVMDGDVVAVYGHGDFIGMHRVAGISKFSSRPVRIL
jgi:tRNA pseudouridine55 synthase